MQASYYWLSLAPKKNNVCPVILSLKVILSLESTSTHSQFPVWFGFLVVMERNAFSWRQWHLPMSSKLLYLQRVMHLGFFATSICTEASAKDVVLPLPAYIAVAVVILFGVTRLTDGLWLSPTAAAWRFGKAEEHVEIREEGVVRAVMNEWLCNKMCTAWGNPRAAEQRRQGTER